MGIPMFRTMTRRELAALRPNDLIFTMWHHPSDDGGFETYRELWAKKDGNSIYLWLHCFRETCPDLHKRTLGRADIYTLVAQGMMMAPRNARKA